MMRKLLILLEVKINVEIMMSNEAKKETPKMTTTKESGVMLK